MGPDTGCKVHSHSSAGVQQMVAANQSGWVAWAAQRDWRRIGRSLEQGGSGITSRRPGPDMRAAGEQQGLQAHSPGSCFAGGNGGRHGGMVATWNQLYAAGDAAGGAPASVVWSGSTSA